MSHSKVSVKDAHLPSALSTAVADLLKVDDVRVDITLPDGIQVTDVRVKLSAQVGPTDDSAPAVDDGSATPDDHDEPRRAPRRPAPVADAAQVDDADRDDDAVDVDHGDQLDREVDAAADFVEGLLDAMDLTGELELRLNDAEQSAEVEVVDMDSGALIGRRGSTLEAVQELMRCALQSQFERRVRITVDVEGYRARRLEKLLDKADEAIDEVLDTGEAVRLEPMDVFERKAVHELVGTVDGVLSRSQGREPSRRVVIEPTDD